MHMISIEALSSQLETDDLERMQHEEEVERLKKEHASEIALLKGQIQEVETKTKDEREKLAELR